MTTDVRVAPATRAAPAAATRPGPLRLVAAQSRHNLAAFVRTPTAAFFTVVFPLTFLLIVGSSVGARLTTDGVRVSQYLVAPFAVFGVSMECFCILATSTATLRESGVLMRLRGTPVPAWTVIASRIVAAAVVSMASVAILVTVGVTGYGVHIVWAKVPAALLALLSGIVCFTALGMAVVALCRSVVGVQAATNGLLIPLAFISNVFIVGTALPAALDLPSRVLPLRHFADALAGAFDPVAPGTGFAWTDLAVLAGWAAAGLAVALWRFGWEPRLGERRRAPVAAEEVAPGAAATTVATREVGRPSIAALLAGQVRYALRGLLRDRAPVFFALVLPALLLLLFPRVFHGAAPQGMRMSDFMVPGMIVYAAAVAAYVNMAEQIVRARAAGVLERLRGSPVPLAVYAAGRMLGALVVSLLAMLVLLQVAVWANGYHVQAAQLPAALVTVVAAAACFGALGLAVLTLMPSAGNLVAVTLGTLMPLTFLSDVFYLGTDLPRPLQIVGDVFPLKHAMHALLPAMRPGATGTGFAWGHLAVVLAWTLAALLVARRGPWRSRTTA
jgi:ABC-2 type transport system permease protein